MSLNNHRSIGTHGEDIAVNYLIKKGYSIVTRNFHYSNRGEIDIIATHNNIIIFIEVKTDLTGKYGPPEYWVNKHKMQQIGKVANYYLYSTNQIDKCCRFDVITVKNNIINHIQDAFRTSIGV